MSKLIPFRKPPAFESLGEYNQHFLNEADLMKRTFQKNSGIKRTGQVRLSVVCSFLLAVSLCGFGTFKALTAGSSAGAAVLSKSLAEDSLRVRTETAVDAGKYQLTGTSSGETFRTKLTPIETLQVCQRVRADAPTDEVDLQFGSEVISSEWRKLTLTAPKVDGSTSDIVLLRPIAWLEQNQAVVDGHVYITVPECGIDGNARIHNIEPCPQIIDGPGRVITGTFRHRAQGGLALRVAGEQEPIKCTGNHPFWSEDRQEFVRADTLQIGEQLRTASGLTQITAATPIEGDTFVYNLEVHGLHVYHVGDTGLLVHNSAPCSTVIGLGLTRFTSVKTALQRRWKALTHEDWQSALGTFDATDLASFSYAFRQATRKADEIVFSLDGNFNISRAIKEGAGLSNNTNTTSWEFLQILNNPELLAKTKFVRGTNVVNILDELALLGLKP